MSGKYDFEEEETIELKNLQSARLKRAELTEGNVDQKQQPIETANASQTRDH